MNIQTLFIMYNRHKKIYLFILVGLFGLLMSCQKYVDVKPASSVSLIETANDAQLLLNNYSLMNTNLPSDGEASAGDYYLSDNSYNSIFIGITDEDRTIYLWKTDAIRQLASNQWQTPYNMVYTANLIVNAQDKIKSTTDQQTADDLQGQALFFRAYYFWAIAQSYTKPYLASSADKELGIPLRLSPDVNGISSRGTLKETYDQIIQDLIQASTLFKPTVPVSSRPGKVAAIAMLARVYLSMNDYSNALLYADQALKLNSTLIDYNTLSSQNSTPFERFNKETIFYSCMFGSALLTPSSAKIVPDLASSYANNDLRKVIFLKKNSDSLTYRFIGNYEPSTGSNFFTGLATDELYLIRAECYARTGNTNGAMADLNTLLVTRWKTGTYVNMTATNADDALNQILIERRKELLMRGLRWTDLRRLNPDTRFAKTLTRVIGGITYTLPPNDNRYTLLIPNQVVINSSIQQNIR